MAVLELVYGPDWRALSSYAETALVRDAGEGLAGRVLIVPEQYSFEAERALCEAGGDTVSRFAEVLSFSRLAERACAKCGGAARPVMDQGGRIMALSRTVDQLRDRLQFYAAGARRADFLLQLLSMVDELKCYCVDSKKLFDVQHELDGTLAVKTQELALLLEGYEAACESGMADPRDRLRLLCDHVRERGFGRDLRLYVDGFSGFTALELQILEAFLAQGTDITVCLCCDDLFSGAQVFAGVRHTARDILAAADRCGVRVTRRAVAAPAGSFSQLALSAFARTAAEASGLRLYACAQPREEIAAICADILAHVRGGGRFRDVSVACADPETLRPILEAEFSRCGIPAFFTGKQPALRTPMLSAVLCALRAASGRMEAADVMGYLKSDCAPISPAECDLLENYAVLWDISGERWLKDWTLHPRGFGYELESADRQTLEALNALRMRSLAPLGALRDALRQGGAVGEYVLAVHAFLQRIGFSDSVSRRLEALDRAGSTRQAQVTRQLHELLLRAMEQMYGVQYDARCSPEEFVRRMEILLSQYQVGAIPAVLDAVTVGQIGDLQHRRTRQLYLCGCTEGCFPGAISGGSLLNEPERRRLRALGVSLAPDENAQMDRALAGAYALLCAPDERLCISASGQSAYVFSTLCRLYPDAVRGHSEAASVDFANARSLGLWLARHPGAEAAPQEAARYAQALRRASAYDFGALTRDVVRGLYGDTVALSASRIDRYAMCRFHFFLRDGLQARERKAAAFDAPMYGSFVHYVLEQTLAQVRREGGFHCVEDERVQTIARGYMDTYLHEQVDPLLMESERFSYLLYRNYDEIDRVVAVLCDEMKHSAFEPADFELSFGHGRSLPPVRVDTPEGSAELSGAVDRVDLFESGDQTFFRVVDYKTGRKDFDYTDLLERRGLQMLIYMFALEQSGAQRYGRPVHPSGVLYVPAHDDVLRLDQRPGDDEKMRQERQKSHRRQGLLLDDDLLLQAMEPCGEGQPKLLPYKNGKQGRTGDLMDMEQLGLLRRYVSGALSKVTEEIHTGGVRPDPYIRGSVGSCTYCPYAGVCHLDLCKIEPRALHSTKSGDFWARLAQREANHG